MHVVYDACLICNCSHLFAPYPWYMGRLDTERDCERSCEFLTALKYPEDMGKQSVCLHWWCPLGRRDLSPVLGMEPADTLMSTCPAGSALFPFWAARSPSCTWSTALGREVVWLGLGKLRFSWKTVACSCQKTAETCGQQKCFCFLVCPVSLVVLSCMCCFALWLAWGLEVEGML